MGTEVTSWIKKVKWEVRQSVFDYAFAAPATVWFVKR